MPGIFYIRPSSKIPIFQHFIFTHTAKKLMSSKTFEVISVCGNNPTSLIEILLNRQLKWFSTWSSDMQPFLPSKYHLHSTPARVLPRPLIWLLSSFPVPCLDLHLRSHRTVERSPKIPCSFTHTSALLTLLPTCENTYISFTSNQTTVLHALPDDLFLSLLGTLSLLFCFPITV